MLRARRRSAVVLSILLTCNLAFGGFKEDSKAICVSGGENHTLVLTANNWAWACGPNGLKIKDTTKFYGVLEMNDMKGTKKTTWGNWYYGGPVDQVWDGCLCPAMDAPAIWAACDNAATLPDFGTYGAPLWWMSFHRWAIGYQWNPFLRAATPVGRYPDRLQEEFITTMWQWIVPYLYLRDGKGYYIQATTSEELFQPSNIAEAWDGWDLDSAPGIPWLTETQRRGALTPGWHAGVVWFSTRAALNAARHDGSPNILYADGHVAADANRRIDPVQDGLGDDPAYVGLRANTWSNYDVKMFGNANHLIPRCEFAR